MKLIIQTSIEPFEIGLVDHNKGIAKQEVLFPVAANLFTALENILNNAGTEKKAITEIGFIRGPGSFTGLRTGYAFAQGLARGLKIPLKGIGIFEAIAKMHPKEKIIAAFKRTKNDAFIATIENQKVNFFETPMTFVDIKNLIDNSRNTIIYSNIFNKINTKDEHKKVEIWKIAETIQNIKPGSFKLIYGKTCYVKTIH